MNDNTTVKRVFLENHARIGELLYKLVKFHENHLNVNFEKINWGDVGSAGKVREDLKEICEFLNV